MQRLEVSGAVRPLYGSLGVKELILNWIAGIFRTNNTYIPLTFVLRRADLSPWYLHVSGTLEVNFLAKIPLSLQKLKGYITRELTNI